MAWLVLLALILLFFSYRKLRGDDLGYLDSQVLPAPVGEPSQAHHDIVEGLNSLDPMLQRAGLAAEPAYDRWRHVLEP